eukprot:tig00000789_g4135.t1
MLRAIFFAEFDNVVGPRIAFQSPEGFVSPDVFDAVSEYVITKPQIAGKLITICAFGIKILCLPVCLEKAKYARNALLFNAGFVFAEDAEVEHYEPLVRKLALVLCALETESEFLSRPESKQTLRSILPRLHEQLCEQGECSVPVDAANTISLKLFSPLPPPSEVKEHQVPVPVFDLRRLVTKDWDLTLQQIVPFVDGINYVKRIAREADVEVGVACKCIQQLVYYGCVRVVDIFQFSNVYAVQPEVHQLWHDPALQREVCMLCSKSTAQSFSSQFRGRSVSSGATQSLFHKIMAVLCAMQPGVTLHDICVQHDVYAWGIDIRRLCVLGVIKGKWSGSTEWSSCGRGEVI